MPGIKDYVAATNAAFDAIDTALDTAQTHASGLADDVAFLKDTIKQLQDNPGPISAEDQALLDAAQARVNGMGNKASSLATALSNLDDATQRPAPPTT